MNITSSLVAYPDWNDCISADEDRDSLDSTAGSAFVEQNEQSPAYLDREALNNFATKCALGLAVIRYGSELTRHFQAWGLPSARGHFWLLSEIATKGTRELALFRSGLELLNSSPNTLSEYGKKWGMGCYARIKKIPLYFGINFLIWRVIPSMSGPMMPTFSNVVIRGPIQEELVFRWLLQEGIFFHTVRYGMEALGLSTSNMLRFDETRTLRIGLTSLLFGAYHLLGEHPYGLLQQALFCTIHGIELGLLKESELGIAGAIGNHMTHNMLAWPLLRLLLRASS